MRYYLIAGEASGDIHGANLMRELAAIDSRAEFRFWGGDRMEKAGGSLVRHFRETAFMGFVDVVTHLPIIIQNLRFCKKDITKWSPDVLILIDYPGFNMRISKWASESKLPVKICYYISPQVWAWKARRAIRLKKWVDQMLVILPFEKAFYEKFGFEVQYVGHPLLDEISQSSKIPHWSDKHQLDDRPIVALLPGSRSQEIKTLLPTMLSITDEYPAYQFVIAGVSSVDKRHYDEAMHLNNIHLVIDETHDLLQHAFSAIVASGTATLETALYEVPQVVCYRGSHLNYLIARRLIKVSYISLVNLILEENLVTELIQDDFRPDRVISELEMILSGEKRTQVLRGYQKLKKVLQGAGASQRAAQLIYKLSLRKQNSDN